MTALDQLIPLPRLLELDHIDLAAPPAQVWELVRHGDLARSPLVRALFTLRTLPDRMAGRKAEPGQIRLDDLVSSPERPGFQVLGDDPSHQVTVGAIGKVWHLDIPFVHVANAEAYARFDQPGFVKVAWAVRVVPRGQQDSRVEFELRVDATDEEAWRAFRRYFRVIGPFSRFIRRSTLASLARELGDPAAKEEARTLPGDELLSDAGGQLTHGITIAATPEQIWPWLIQMGGGRAGYYSIDTLDNGGKRSARELHPELAEIAVGDVLPATVEGPDGFEVLALQEPRTLILGGLFDVGANAQRPFRDPRPEQFWHVTWAFVLEPLDQRTTRLHVRARAAFSKGDGLHAIGIRPIHHLMQTAQLRNLAARVEGRLRDDDWRDVLSGLGGASLIAFNFLTPFRRASRSHWGLDQSLADRSYPGDDLVPEPRWSWTHGIEIDATAEEVWGWVAQIGADRGGFYSYQWLENVTGCEVRNAERVHPEWELRAGDHLRLHPKMPPLTVVQATPRRHLLAFAGPDATGRTAGKPWVAASWLFFLEDLGSRCRLVSRFRSDCSDDLRTRLTNAPQLVEPVGFAMDRRMLQGIKTRAEAAAARPRGSRAVTSLATPTRSPG